MKAPPLSYPGRAVLHVQSRAADIFFSAADQRRGLILIWATAG